MLQLVLTFVLIVKTKPITDAEALRYSSAGTGNFTAGRRREDICISRERGCIHGGDFEFSRGRDFCRRQAGVLIASLVADSEADFLLAQEAQRHRREVSSAR